MDESDGYIICTILRLKRRGGGWREAMCHQILNNIHGSQCCDESDRFIDFAHSDLHKIRIPPTRPTHAERSYTYTLFSPCVVTSTGKGYGVRLITAINRPGRVRNGPNL